MYKLSIVSVALCRKHAFDASLLVGRARQEGIVAGLDVSVHVL